MAALIICSIAIFIHGCTTLGGSVHSGPNDQSGYRHPPVAKNGPPAHAPAHGYRVKHSYRYYPSCSVYFDIGRAVYFYLEGDGWRCQRGIAETFTHVRLGDYGRCRNGYGQSPIFIMRITNNKYPPGQLKKKKSKKWVKSK